MKLAVVLKSGADATVLDGSVRYIINIRKWAHRVPVLVIQRKVDCRYIVEKFFYYKITQDVVFVLKMRYNIFARQRLGQESVFLL